jgi:hypothetical protein
VVMVLPMVSTLAGGLSHHRRPAVFLERRTEQLTIPHCGATRC